MKKVPIKADIYFSKRKNLKTYLKLLNNVFNGLGRIRELKNIDEFIEEDWVPKIYKFILKHKNVDLEFYLEELVDYTTESKIITYLVLRAYLFRNKNKKKNLKIVFKSFNLITKNYLFGSLTLRKLVKESFFKYLNRHIDKLLNEVEDIEDLDTFIDILRYNDSLIKNVKSLKKFSSEKDNAMLVIEVLNGVYKNAITNFSFFKSGHRNYLDMDLGKALLLIEDEDLQKTLVKSFLRSTSLSLNNKIEIVKNPELYEKYKNLPEVRQLAAELI